MRICAIFKNLPPAYKKNRTPPQNKLTVTTRRHIVQIISWRLIPKKLLGDSPRTGVKAYETQGPKRVGVIPKLLRKTGPEKVSISGKQNQT
ncbi:hypothetical protein GWI33_010641 [Rhynchophorus ferrugineus]|uniref:Uncharacterized protein n=1 Tax=Rhynchophorus ferrugineus TaxID=354439 RepID=A0A834J1R4_RHYFE|nr:hypothetical protein GWI33_010641 [Rhynchophorus ferrugineus]